MKHKKFHRTGILIATIIPNSNTDNFLEYFETEMKKIIPEESILFINDFVKKVYEQEKVWDKKWAEPRRVLLIDGSNKNAEKDEQVHDWEYVFYKHLTSGRKSIKYSLSEALLRMLFFFKLGLINNPENKSLMIHLKHVEKYYPCILKLSHNRDKTLRLNIIQCYPKMSLIDGDYFLT